MTLPSFAHVLSMSDGIGMFEHADHAEPRREEGYCTDDVARLLIVAVREPAHGQAVRELGRTAFESGDIDLIELNIYETAAADAELQWIDAQWEHAFYRAIYQTAIRGKAF